MTNYYKDYYECYYSTNKIKRIRADFQNAKGMYLAATGKQEQRKETELKKREEYRK